MGLTCSLHRASDAEIDALIEDPDSLDEFLDREYGRSPKVREVRLRGFGGFITGLFGIKVSEIVPEHESHPPFEIDRDNVIDIEKAWHGLHFLFTGGSAETEEPATFLLSGGEPIDDEGFARALRPEQVHDFAGFLAGLSRVELARRYDPEAMSRLAIYPDLIWKRRDTHDDPQEWLLDCFDDIREFITKAAHAGSGVVICIS